MRAHRSPLTLLSAALILAIPMNLAAQPAAGGKKLLVFILSGQSNMQGHAEVSTLAYLPKPAYLPTAEEFGEMISWQDRHVRRDVEPTLREELMKDPENAKLPRNEFGALLQKAVDAEVAKARAAKYAEFKRRQADPARAARDKELAALFTPRLTDETVLATAASAKGLKDARELADHWAEKTGVPVGKRAFIAAYGGVNRGESPGVAQGPLNTGYGARPTAFGPEYAFGIMIERALDQPILIIKAAWGGKSLHYDFRPPSAGPYQATENEKNQMEQWKVRKAAWDKYVAGGGTPAASAQTEREIKTLEAEKQKLQASIAKLAKEEQAAAQAKVTEMNAGIKTLRDSWVRPPGDAPTRDEAGFYWNEMIGFVRKVLSDPQAYHPEYDPAAGFEVAGGVWFQGFNDQFDPEYYGNYSSNMVRFIQDLRKEVKQPEMPFVIGVLGTPAFREEALANNVANGQREAAKSPELAGTVAAVESWPLTTPEVAVWRAKKDAARASGDAAEITRTEQQWILHGSNQGYHYDGSGRFFIRLGDEFAGAMLKLMENAK
jgi:hypothetical protein